MSDAPYLALYRRYRPGRFDEVEGQTAVVESLCGALAADRFAHAYLFCGPRGTGKTSVARLLARAVNCEDRQDGEACGSCRVCEAFAEGRSPDVHEIDAASNRRIAEMRELLDQVAYSPTFCRYKVYILDEAHMLTGEAANAFLKTLEEPPPHVLFVLATTEAHKILPTISSRCQVFEFRKIPEAACRDLLVRVAEAEGAELTPEAAAFVARRSGGAMRDALALLERLLASGEGPIDRERVGTALGLVPEEVLVELVRGIADRETGQVYGALDEVERQGRDPRKLLVDLLEVFRSLLRFKAGVAGALDGAGDQARKALEELGARLETSRLLSVLNRLDAGIAEARQGVLPAFSVELALLEALHLEVLYDRSQLEARLERLEAAPRTAALAQDSKPLPGAGPPAPDAAPPTERAAAVAPPSVPVPPAPPARPVEAAPAIAEPRPATGDGSGAPSAPPGPASSVPSGGGGDLDATWEEVLRRAREASPMTQAFLREANLRTREDGTLEIVHTEAFRFHHERLAEDKHRGLVSELLAQVVGGAPAFELVLEDGGGGGGGRGNSPGGAREDDAPPAPPRKKGRGRDWYEDRVLENETVKMVVEELDGKVVRID